jgi:hypothetical protein
MSASVCVAHISTHCNLAGPCKSSQLCSCGIDGFHVHAMNTPWMHALHTCTCLAPMYVLQDPYFNEPNVELMRGTTEGNITSMR